MKSIERVLGAIETGIAEIAEASQKKTDLAPLVEAIKSIKPTVTVHVPAAPAPIVQILPQENQKEGATWELRMPGAYGAPERVLTVKRVA